MNALALQEMPQIQKERVMGEIFVSPYRLLLDEFEPRIRINIERDDYIIKTAETGDELEETLCLRHDVFYKELIGKKLPYEIDIETGEIEVLLECDREYITANLERLENFRKEFELLL